MDDISKLHRDMHGYLAGERSQDPSLWAECAADATTFQAKHVAHAREGRSADHDTVPIIQSAFQAAACQVAQSFEVQ